ncbi:hypothetical protein GPX89_09270 [Nocardia sp. ET3-3]|uniref:Uncharacterized protein n=1 Tax=Nocardia terrae TaxID=2675851 RepID=A0A7K1USW1_9NOCA|nr:hypothetical protein [Nocardia terrae]MVU77437.1 hypothetical protein [Nocardia terrae]
MGSTGRRVWYRHPDGYAIDSDELVETATGWVKPAPIFCPQGHQFGPDRTLVGWQACRGPGCDGHTAHTCQTCGEAVYSPALREGCDSFSFDGRA